MKRALIRCPCQKLTLAGSIKHLRVCVAVSGLKSRSDSQESDGSRESVSWCLFPQWTVNLAEKHRTRWMLKIVGTHQNGCSLDVAKWAAVSRDASMLSTRVLCADPEQERLSRLVSALRKCGFKVGEADSAVQCVLIAARQKPDAVTLDSDLLHVDMENIAGYICRVSPASKIILTVDDTLRWSNTPAYVSAVAARENADQVISLLREMFLVDERA